MGHHFSDPRSERRYALAQHRGANHSIYAIPFGSDGKMRVQARPTGKSKRPEFNRSPSRCPEPSGPSRASRAALCGGRCSRPPFGTSTGRDRPRGAAGAQATAMREPSRVACTMSRGRSPSRDMWFSPLPRFAEGCASAIPCLLDQGERHAWEQRTEGSEFERPGI